VTSSIANPEEKGLGKKGDAPHLLTLKLAVSIQDLLCSELKISFLQK
jgi:hypothetical protein